MRTWLVAAVLAVALASPAPAGQEDGDRPGQGESPGGEVAEEHAAEVAAEHEASKAAGAEGAAAGDEAHAE